MRWRAACAAGGLLLLGASCTDQGTLEDASVETMAEEVAARLPAIARCWTAGDKRGSHLAGDEHRLRITVLPTGKVKTAFVEPAHNKHPVGSCVRSAFDGLRFAPREVETQIDVPLALGAAVGTPTAGTPVPGGRAASQPGAAGP